MDPIMKSIFGSMPLENLLKNQTNTINNQKNKIWLLMGLGVITFIGLGVLYYQKNQLQNELDAIKIKHKK